VLFKGVLVEHMGVASSALGSNVFPDSAGIDAMRELIRA
jgi:uncharacterized protein (DUF1501 family)